VPAGQRAVFRYGVPRQALRHCSRGRAGGEVGGEVGAIDDFLDLWDIPFGYVQRGLEKAGEASKAAHKAAK
jgi:hypothetical protein